MLAWGAIRRFPEKHLPMEISSPKRLGFSGVLVDRYCVIGTCGSRQRYRVPCNKKGSPHDHAVTFCWEICFPVTHAYTGQRTTSHVLLVLSKYFVTGSFNGLGLTKNIRLAGQPRVYLSSATSPCHHAWLSHVGFGNWAQLPMSARKYVSTWLDSPV